MADLDYVNGQVLAFVQALLGCISQNMRVISLVPQGKGAVLRFLLEEDSAEDREEIEDIVSEYFCLRATGEEGAASSQVVIMGSREIEHEDLEGRPIYIRKHP